MATDITRNTMPESNSKTFRDHAEELLARFPGVDRAELLGKVTALYLLDFKHGNKREERAACDFLNLLQFEAVKLPPSNAGAAGANALRAFIQRQQEWSAKTFGPGARTKGLTAHIRKELLEIEAAPQDVKEWIDVVILALDGAWRAGYSPEQICTALEAKQAENFRRTYPKPLSEDHPSEHHRD